MKQKQKLKKLGLKNFILYVQHQITQNGQANAVWVKDARTLVAKVLRSDEAKLKHAKVRCQAFMFARGHEAF